jgi:hypothetical protein
MSRLASISGASSHAICKCSSEEKEAKNHSADGAGDHCHINAAQPAYLDLRAEKLLGGLHSGHQNLLIVHIAQVLIDQQFGQNGLEHLIVRP